MLLESARTIHEFGPAHGSQPLACAYALVATFLLTGAREDEIRRLRIRHLDFPSNAIHIPGTKTRSADRIVPMHPQLREILEPYVARLGRRSSELLFTNAAGESFGDWRKTLDAIAVRAGFKAKRIRTRVFRTSYITHRLACIDHGTFIEPYKVAREVGHKSTDTTLWIYGRIQRKRVRMEELAFRTSAIGPELQDRLRALYLPAAPPEKQGAKESAELVARFFAAAAGMQTAQIVAATGLSKATVKRLRAGGFETVQESTKAKLLAYMEPKVGDDQPPRQPRVRPRIGSRLRAQSANL